MEADIREHAEDGDEKRTTVKLSGRDEQALAVVMQRFGVRSRQDALVMCLNLVAQAREIHVHQGCGESNP